MIRTRKNGFMQFVKDYIVPIIGLLLVAVLIFSFFWNDSKEITTTTTEDQIGINLTLIPPSSEVYIVYPGDDKKQIQQSTTLYKGEKIVVKEGSVKLDFPSIGSMFLNKIGELKYNEKGDLSLFSSDLWISSISPINIDMRYGSIKIGKESTISLTQNEVGSTFYLIDGFAEVSNISDISTVLVKGQKLTIHRKDATSSDIDLSLLKEDIDDYFKSSDWFIKNNGDFYLVENSDTGNTGTGVVVSSDDYVIKFDNLTDESSVKSPSLDIVGKYFVQDISKITLNGDTASLNEEDKTFVFKGFSLENRVNDLVFKVYDSSDNVIEKYIYTVYHDLGLDNLPSSTGFQVKNFDIDASDFKFISPSITGTHTTNGDFVTIKGSTPAKTVSRVSINGYTLKSFNGNDWRYHARTTYNNLKNGTNLYEIKYYDKSNNLIYTNYFTIIKKTQKNKDSEL